MTENVSLVLYVGLAIAAGVFWYRQRSTPAMWLALTLGSLGLIVLAGRLIPERGEGAPPLATWDVEAILVDVIIVVLVAFPYFLFRFWRSMTGVQSFWTRLVDILMVGWAVAIIAMPPFPEPDASGPQPLYLRLFTWFFFPWWGGLLAFVAWKLFRAGRHQSGVVRWRMRFLGVAAILMAIALLLTSNTGGDERSDVATLLQALVGWGSAGAFLLGFNPPGPLRRLWRARDESTLRAAEAQLLSASEPEVAAEAILAPAASLVGGGSGEILDDRGRVLATLGASTSLANAEDVVTISTETSTVRVSRSPYTPVFGEEEVALLRQLAGHLDLALQRLSAFEVSERSRIHAERATQELQQLVYGVSHDLRNPLVTVLGFLRLLERESEDFTANAKHAVLRMKVSATYMEGLIDDLLQLSRIGRTDSDREAVDLGQLIEDIGRDLSEHYAGVMIESHVDAHVVMNALRARQLFINLMENAARHGGRDGLRVTVRSEPVVNGFVTILVEDNGVGIPQADRARVFQIFQRLERFDASAPGSGIGLTLCRRIVEDIGGTIDIGDPEQGTSIRVRLPIGIEGESPDDADLVVGSAGA